MTILDVEMKDLLHHAFARWQESDWLEWMLLATRRIERTRYKQHLGSAWKTVPSLASLACLGAGRA